MNRETTEAAEALGLRPMALIVVAYNSADVLPGLLDSLPAALEGMHSAQIIVVDNDSSDASVALARGHRTGPTVIEAGRNGGYSAGVNLAAASAPNMDLLILNPDIRLHKGAVRQISDALRPPNAGLVAPKMFHEDGTLTFSIRREPSVLSAWAESLIGGNLASRLGLGEIVRDRHLYTRGGSIDWATGAMVGIAARCRERVGPWDESFFLYSEEVDYCRRVRASGLSVSYLPDAAGTHIGGDYHQSAWLSSLMTTNRIRYHSRHHGGVSTAAFRLGVAVGAAMRCISGPGQRAALRASLTFEKQETA
jgi:N-acetylglucosaminyl-diphospho-decaprenol L-rhamnosyltransferase